jgi:hypothetical protein
MAGPWEDFREAGPWSDYASAKPKRKAGAGEKFAGAMTNLYRGTGILDEVQGGLRAAENVIRGRSKVDPLAMAGAQVAALAGPNPVAQNLFAKSGVGAAFKQGMSEQRAQEDAFAADHPAIANQARGVGMAGTVFMPAGAPANLFASGSRVANAARGATTASATAAGYSAVDRGSGKERLAAAGEAARNPLVLGLGAAGGAASAAARPKAAKPKRRPVPTVDEMRSVKTAAYQAVDDAGVTYTPEAFADVVTAITAEMRAGKINPRLHPNATEMLRELQKMKGQSPTLTQLDQLRQVIRRDVASRGEAEKFFADKMMANIDEFIAAAGPSQVRGAGDAARGAAAISKARDSNTRYRKVKAVNEAVEGAERRAAGNVDNAIRQNLRRVLETTRNLTPEERAALETIVRGDNGQNLLRLAGKTSPQGSGLMLGAHLAASAATGGVSSLAAGLGAGAKVAADTMTKRKVADLVRLIADGGSRQQLVAAERELAKIAAKDPAAAALHRAVRAKLSKAAGVAGAGASANIFAQPAQGASSQ